MSLIAIIVVIICIYLAFKVAGFMFKLLMWALVIGGLYWLAAPYLNMPLPV